MKLHTILEQSHADVQRIRAELVAILKRRATQEELADALLNYVLRCIREESQPL